MNEKNVTDEYLRRRNTEREVERETAGGMWVIMYGAMALGIAVAIAIAVALTW